MFDDLMTSVQEMGDIVKGEAQPSRRFNFKPMRYDNMTKTELEAQQAQVAIQLISTERQLKAITEQYDAFTNAIQGYALGESAVKAELDQPVAPAQDEKNSPN